MGALNLLYNCHVSTSIVSVKLSLIIVGGYFIFSNAKILFGEEGLSNSKCPRCGAEAVELGTPTIKVGKTRQMRVFYEGITE